MVWHRNKLLWVDYSDLKEINMQIEQLMIIDDTLNRIFAQKSKTTKYCIYARKFYSSFYIYNKGFFECSYPMREKHIKKIFKKKCKMQK